MSKKYLYNLGKGLQEYNLDEIARYLEVDKDFIEAILYTEKDDIDYACFEALKEKSSKKNILFLLENFTSRYFSKKGVYPLLNEYYNIQNNKKSFINSLEFNLENFKDDYLILSKKGLNLLTVNTDMNFDKPVYGQEDIEYIKSLKEIVNGSNKFSGCSDKTINILSNEVGYTKEISNQNNYNSLVLTVDATKNLLQKTKSYKLPKIYNELVFDEILSDKSACNITYFKR